MVLKIVEVVVVTICLPFYLLVGVCYFIWKSTERILMYSKLFRDFRLERQRKKYSVGAKLTRFVACDIRREIVVVDASSIDTGYITVRSRTWNVLYQIKGNTAIPPFDEPKRVEIVSLWNWDGPSWGGPVPPVEQADPV